MPAGHLSVPLQRFFDPNDMILATVNKLCLFTLPAKLNPYAASSIANHCSSERNFV
jgi:hypothetical protein